MPNGGKIRITTPASLSMIPTSGKILSIKHGPYVMISVGDTARAWTAKLRPASSNLFHHQEKAKEPASTFHSYGIIKQSGGYVFVQSELGRARLHNVFPARGRAL